MYKNLLLLESKENPALPKIRDLDFLTSPKKISAFPEADFFLSVQVLLAAN